MSAVDGRILDDLSHLHQSITDLLTTRLGSRVMRRDYGSRLFELVDRPIGPELKADIHMAVAEALDRWEPRLRLLSVDIDGASPGKVNLDLLGEYLPDGKRITLEGIRV
jgi:phage baseplate assembly protein W